VDASLKRAEITHFSDTRQVLPCRLLSFCSLTFLSGSIPDFYRAPTTAKTSAKDLPAKPRKRKKIAAPEISPEAAPFKESGSQPEPRTQRHPLELVRLHFPYPIVELGVSAFHEKMENNGCVRCTDADHDRAREAEHVQQNRVRGKESFCRRRHHAQAGAPAKQIL
jgi:hypothetical protein